MQLPADYTRTCIPLEEGAGKYKLKEPHQLWWGWPKEGLNHSSPLSWLLCTRLP